MTILDRPALLTPACRTIKLNEPSLLLLAVSTIPISVAVVVVRIAVAICASVSTSVLCSLTVTSIAWGDSFMKFDSLTWATQTKPLSILF